MSDPLFPASATPDAYTALARDEATLRRCAEAACARAGFPGLELVRFAGGSLPVYAAGDRLVLKLYPPCYRHEGEREGLVLEVVDNRVPIRTPAVVAAGEIEGWWYLVMERLPGRSLVEAWPELGRGDRRRLASRLGEALARLHDLRDARLAPLRPDWAAFVAAQRESAAARQRARGLDERWAEQIPEFLAAVDLGEPAADSLLHTEVMREHLLVTAAGGPVALGGLFDFEPAMIGAPEYEFAAVGLFFTCGEAGLLRETLSAYGYGAPALDHALSRRLLAWALLHRYSHLGWYLERLPPPECVRTLDEFAAHAFGCGDSPS